MQSITNTKENAWEEMKEPITSRHGRAKGHLLEEALEIFFIFGNNQNFSLSDTSTNPGILLHPLDCSVKRLVFLFHIHYF